MKTTTLKLSLSSGIVALALLSACASTEQAADASKPAAAAPAPTPIGQPSASSAPAAKPAPAAARMNPLNDPSNILYKRSVFHDYDKADVKPSDRPLLEAHARYLRENPNAQMTIEGNCDERGSREYNVALGQRRAESVKKVMTALGAGDRQIEAVSFGEEKPKANGHDESAWTQNRRSDLNYTRQQ